MCVGLRLVVLAGSILRKPRCYSTLPVQYALFELSICFLPVGSLLKTFFIYGRIRMLVSVSSCLSRGFRLPIENDFS